VTKGGDFRQMMEANPNLGELDSAAVHRAFNTLHRFSPELASDPIVAGSWIKRTVQFGAGDMPMETVRDLIGTRKSIREGRPDMRLDTVFAKNVLEGPRMVDQTSQGAQAPGEQAYQDERGRALARVGGPFEPGVPAPGEAADAGAINANWQEEQQSRGFPADYMDPLKGSRA